MILCYQGSPGSGKTYDAVNRIIENLKRGRVVYTNIDGLDDSLNREVIKVLTNIDDFELSKQLVYLSSDQIACFWKHVKSGSMIIIDEIHKWFNSRDWQSAKNREFADWASTHRHQGYDVIMVTQDINKVDSQVRSVVEFTYEYRKLNMFGSMVKNRYICYAYMGGEVSGRPMGKNTRSYNQKIFAAYKSYITGDVKELGIQSHFNILRHPIFYSVPLVIILFLYFFSKSSFARGDILGMSKISKPVAVVKPVSPVKDGAKTVFYEQIKDKNGKPLGDPTLIDLSSGKAQTVPLLKEKKKKVSMPLNPFKGQNMPFSAPGALSFQTPEFVTNVFKGFVAMGDDVLILIGSEKKSLSELKNVHPDVEIRDDTLYLSGRVYSVGDRVVL